eukprot:16451389-Heterocapsa_arctica.AAC.1
MAALSRSLYFQQQPFQNSNTTNHKAVDEHYRFVLIPVSATKTAPPEKTTFGQLSAKLGVESNQFCWSEGHRLAQKQSAFADTGISAAGALAFPASRS